MVSFASPLWLGLFGSLNHLILSISDGNALSVFRRTNQLVVRSLVSYTILMGVGLYESIIPHIPLFPVNYRLANQCYLIIHDTSNTKQSHMSVLIDIGGNSTDDTIFGVLIHAVANLSDGLCPHGTSLSHDLWHCDREKLRIIHLGGLTDSEYLTGQRVIPDYLIGEYVQPNLYHLIANTSISNPIRQGSLVGLAAQVYTEMALKHGETWSSSMNCQQFSRRFIVDGLGLRWPETIDVSGDAIPLSIDIGIYVLSAKHK